MPPKKASGTTKKRSLEEPDQAQRASKRVTPSAEEPALDAQGSAADPGSTSAPTQRRISRGPNGEALVPRAMPAECHKDIEKIPIPSSWIYAIDATPDRCMTLGSREWWEDYGPWLQANKAKLKLKAKDWKRKDEALKTEWKPKEGTGNDDWDFVCLSERTSRDDEDEDDEDDEWEDTDEDDEEDDDEDGEENEQGQAEKSNKNKADEAVNDSSKPKKENPVGKLASLYPDHISIVSMLGQDRTLWWQYEALKRDQDDFLLHIYNDFSNYGKLEVLGNIFLHFEKVLNKKDLSHREIWAELEGLALVLDSDLLDFTMCDDSEQCGQIIGMIGFLVIIVMDLLKKKNVLSPNSDIPNLGFILGLLVKWGWQITADFDGWDNQGTWVHRVIQLAEQANITLRGPGKFEEILEKINADNEGVSLAKWKPASWSAKVKSFKSKHGHVGGNHYDITKMSAAERKRHSYA